MLSGFGMPCIAPAILETASTLGSLRYKNRQ
jgi:hypothetical protein